MNLVSVAARNVLRNRFRTAMTVAGVAVAVLAFVMLRTVVWAYTVGAEVAAKDRIITRHKVTFVMTMPKRYVDVVRETPGVTKATWANWFGGKEPKHEHEFFSTLAVDPITYFDVYDEMQISPAEKQAFIENRRACVIGDVLAKKLGWKVGDKIRLASQIYPGDWDLDVVAIYAATKKSVDRSTLVFHWSYLNDALPKRRSDQVGWIVSKVSDAPRAAELGVAIDKVFDERDIQTLSQSERAFNTSFIGFFSAILRVIDIVSVVILVIMMLILGNTIAMGVRDRTKEYGTLRAIGFLPRHVVIFVLGEAATIGVLGGAVGLLVAYPFVNQAMGRFIEENMGSFFPYFRVEPVTAIQAFVLALSLACLASVLPAWRASRLRVVDALRRIA